MKLTSIALGLQFESARCYMFLCLTPKSQPVRGITALGHTDNLEVLLFIIHSFYIALYIFAALEQTAHMSHVILNEWLCPFLVRIINIHRSGVLVTLLGCCMAGATWNAAVMAQVLCTPFKEVEVKDLFSFCISGLEYWAGGGDS